MNKRLMFAFVLLVGALATFEVHGQQRGTFIPQTLLDVLPSSLTPHAQALGNRVLRPGKERTTMTSELVTADGERRPLRVTLQLPLMVRIEELKGNAAFVFDGLNRASTASRLEEQLLEIFSSDTAEAMMVSTREGAAVQLLGRLVKAASGDSRPRHDIYEWSGPIRSLPASPHRLKRYAFDSETCLLVYTEYVDDSFSPPVAVRVSFSDWRTIEDSAYAGRIDRFENGHQVFSWTAKEIVPSHRQEPAMFTDLHRTER